ncbi:Glutarate-semialdehyde dehydrogenase DavD [Nymphon striatum]|nr:Glutarate-semialdehyde dehydrogenase DavD [Nymphon striatum]
MDANAAGPGGLVAPKIWRDKPVGELAPAHAVLDVIEEEDLCAPHCLLKQPRCGRRRFKSCLGTSPNAMIPESSTALAVELHLCARPAELTPLSSPFHGCFLGERAGIPKGVFSAWIPSSDASAIAKNSVATPKWPRLPLTGALRVVVKILMEQGLHVKRISMELGGNAPFIVFDDADVDAAVQGEAR